MADFAGAKAAIRQRLEDRWTVTPITYQNETPANWPPKDADGLPAPFVTLEIGSTRSEMRGAGRPGSQVWCDEGFVYVHVFVPSGQGDDQASRYAVQIGETFRGAKFYDAMPGHYVRTWAPRIDGGGEPHRDCRRL